VQVTTKKMDQDWDVNIEYDMFQDDKSLQANTWRSDRRRRNEKNEAIQKMGKVFGEEEQDARLKIAFDLFMDQPKDQRTFIDFKQKLVTQIEEPSDHTVMVRLNGEKHIIKVTANGRNTSSMSKLVLDNICRTIVGNSNRIEKRRQKQEGEEESIVSVVVAMDLLKIYKWISKILMI